MAEYQRMYNSQIEINDLIDDAVKNAVARRHEVLDSEEALLSMSDAEAKSVAGGASLLAKDVCPIILGKLIPPPIIHPPITIGLLAPNPIEIA